MLKKELGFQYNNVLDTVHDLNVKQTINMSVADYTEKILDKFEELHITSKTDRMRR